MGGLPWSPYLTPVVLFSSEDKENTRKRERQANNQGSKQCLPEQCGFAFLHIVRRERKTACQPGRFQGVWAAGFFIFPVLTLETRVQTGVTIKLYTCVLSFNIGNHQREPVPQHYRSFNISMYSLRTNWGQRDCSVTERNCWSPRCHLLSAVLSTFFLKIN